MAGLFAFVAAYLGLTGYPGWVVFRLVGWAIIHGGRGARRSSAGPNG
jgi:threonine/homoserine/homoserine lactone efflux protein